MLTVCCGLAACNKYCIRCRKNGSEFGALCYFQNEERAKLFAVTFAIMTSFVAHSGIGRQNKIKSQKMFQSKNCNYYWLNTFIFLAYV